MARGRVMCAVAMLAGSGAMALAQDGPKRVTLAEAIERAELHSHRIDGLRARVEGATAAVAGQDAAERPIVALSSGFRRTNHVDEFALSLPNQPLRVLYPDIPNNYNARVDLQWPIYTGGRTDSLERAASAERDAAAFDVTAARADLRLEVTRAFWALVTARQAEDVVARSIESVEAHVSDLRSRYDQGLIPPNDVLMAEVQRSRQRLLAIEARNMRGIAEADLRRLIDEPGATSIEPVVPPESIEPAPGEPVTSTTRGTRPELQAVASRVGASREREAAVAASARPQVALGAGFDYARPNFRIFPLVDELRASWDVSVNVNWSLWDGGRRRAEQAETVAGTRALMARASELDRDIAFEVEQRRLELESANAAIPVAREAVTAAVEARRVVGERFTAGVATSTEVLDAQTAVLQAELERTRTVASAHLARARLDRATGAIAPTSR